MLGGEGSDVRHMGSGIGLNGTIRTEAKYWPPRHTRNIREITDKLSKPATLVRSRGPGYPGMMNSDIWIYLSTYNDSVGTGDWSALARLYAENAVVEFAGAPVSALRGRGAIEAGYRAAPPEDTISLVHYFAEGDEHEVTYRRDREGTGGTFRLTIRDGLVAHNVVT